MKIPNPLYPGAAVALVAPGSAIPETQLQKAMDLVRSLDPEAPDYREDLHQTITGIASYF